MALERTTKTTTRFQTPTTDAYSALSRPTPIQRVTANVVPPITPSCCACKVVADAVGASLVSPLPKLSLLNEHRIISAIVCRFPPRVFFSFSFSRDLYGQGSYRLFSQPSPPKTLFHASPLRVTSCRLLLFLPSLSVSPIVSHK
jgi:hypothetical protein